MIEYEDFFWHWIKDPGEHSMQNLALLAGEYFGNWLMVFIRNSEIPSWKPRQMEVGPLEGYHGPGFLPGIQEMPGLVPDLPLTPEWRKSWSTLSTPNKTVTPGHSKEEVCYLKGPTVLASRLSDTFSQFLWEKGLTYWAGRARLSFCLCWLPSRMPSQYRHHLPAEVPAATGPEQTSPLGTLSLGWLTVGAQVETDPVLLSTSTWRSSSPRVMSSQNVKL